MSMFHYRSHAGDSHLDHFFPGHQIDKSRGMRHAVFIHMVNLRPDTFLLNIFAPKIPLFTLFPFLNNHVGNSRPVANGHQNLLRSLIVSSGIKGSIIAHDLPMSDAQQKLCPEEKKETNILDLGKAMMLGKSDPKQIFILPNGGI